MARFKSGTTVRYARSFVTDLKQASKEALVGQVDRVISSTPALVYVHWNDGSYNAISELHLETL